MDELTTGRRCLPLAATLLLLSGVALAQDSGPDPAQIEAQLEHGQSAQAYDTLEAVKDQYAGQLWFDTLLGRAAAKSGHDDEAIEILRQVVDATPGQDTARFYLALAYAHSGDKDAASKEYQYLEKNAASPAARNQAADAVRVLAGGAHEAPTVHLHPGVVHAIRQRERDENRWSAEAFVAAGYDTNANSATQDSNVPVYRLSETDADSRTPFMSVGGEFHYRTISSDPWVWRNSASLGHRSNPSAHAFDTDVVGVQSDLQWKRERKLVASGLFYNTTLVSSSYNDTTFGWQTRFERLTDPALLGATLQYAVVRYNDAFAVRDVDSALLQVSAATPDGEERRFKASIAPLVGIEDARLAGSAFGRRFAGADGSLAWLLSQSLDVQLTASTVFSRYDDDPAAPGGRRDERYQGGVGLTWRPAEHAGWAVSTGVSYTRNQSTAPLFDYDRVLASAELTRSWGGEE
jgi:hypothetical protein